MAGFSGGTKRPFHGSGEIRAGFGRSDLRSGRLKHGFDLVGRYAGVILLELLDKMAAFVILGKGDNATILRGVSLGI
jgi:hypothetical protein